MPNEHHHLACDRRVGRDVHRSGAVPVGGARNGGEVRVTRITEANLAQMVKDNPDLRAANSAQMKREPLTPAASEWLKADRTKLEDRFLAWWQAIGGPELEREYHFAPGRRFRADFCHVASKTIVEVDGGLFTNGAHNSQRTYHYQQERDRIARGLGFEVVRLGTGFTLAQVEETLDIVVRRTPA